MKKLIPAMLMLAVLAGCDKDDIKDARLSTVISFIGLESLSESRK